MDERDFKEVSAVGKLQSKKNRALGFVLTAVSAESSSEVDESTKTVMKVPKKVGAVLKNSQKTKKCQKRQEKQLHAIVSQRLHLPGRQPRRKE